MLRPGLEPPTMQPVDEGDGVEHLIGVGREPQRLVDVAEPFGETVERVIGGSAAQMRIRHSPRVAVERPQRDGAVETLQRQIVAA